MYSVTDVPWIVCQLGAREHYSIALALFERDKLHSLATDAWVTPESVGRFFHSRLRQRNHAALAHASVISWTTGLLSFEAVSRFRRRSGWSLTIARNRWFQTRVARYLSTLHRSGDLSGRPIVFSYSYTALAPFRAAKRRGWRTILGQIDPGRLHERIIVDLHHRYPQDANSHDFPPEQYWADWREECDLADVIMVNSEWSKNALLREGIPDHKLAVVPLAYQPPAGSTECGRRYPKSVSPQQPLRVLFLGNVNAGKGIYDLIRAAEMLKTAPVAFDVVGNHTSVSLPRTENLRFHGPVSRAAVSTWYRHADLFVLPTHSDGFGLTQVEAMAHGLPVIATPHCGSVVQAGLNGWLVKPGCPEQLATAIDEAISHPNALEGMSAAAIQRAQQFSIGQLGVNLSSLEMTIPACQTH
jgi:glycosyltransferase involved in cell wall biosynthesis